MIICSFFLEVKCDRSVFKAHFFNFWSQRASVMISELAVDCETLHVFLFVSSCTSMLTVHTAALFNTEARVIVESTAGRAAFCRICGV